MNVPSDWIKSGTLVEYEALDDCPKHNTNKACKHASTSNTKCIWCDNAKMCTTGNDKNVREFKFNICQLKYINQGIAYVDDIQSDVSTMLCLFVDIKQ
ncbi:unnamed protein product [Schistosoma margrebowiei]|uniref:Uncharacterized protein n=1 Tax=Schistosoma margrebowiei TaxID=48269 RepID=A0A183N556_9TREM|nr:unnamed protein product [Schistosoma margrebowiei]